MKNIMGSIRRVGFGLAIIGALLFNPMASFAQELTYNPKGLEDNWNFSLTPFILLPNVSGDIESEYLSEEYGIGTSKFIETLNGTIMMNGEVWKGGFFIAPSYIYNQNEIDKNLWTSSGENLTFNVNPIYKRHIAELIGGWIINLEKTSLINPYLGLRYTHYDISGSFTSNQQIKDFSETTQYWDPIIGIKAHYYPHPRVPIEFKGDIGGFGIGSEYTWSTFLNTGYSATTWLDVLIGFGALGNSYKTTTESGKEIWLKSITYGFDFGLRFYITGREKDPQVYKRFAKN